MYAVYIKLPTAQHHHPLCRDAAGGGAPVPALALVGEGQGDRGVGRLRGRRDPGAVQSGRIRVRRLEPSVSYNLILQL